MRHCQQENLKDAFQTLGKSPQSSLSFIFSSSYCNFCTNEKMLLVINRGLRKSGGKGKKHDKESMRASLDSRLLLKLIYNSLKVTNIQNIY